MSRKLLHYLRHERRAAALTQTDVAILLGVPWNTRVVRYERGYVPPVEMALAYEIILGKPCAKLLGSYYREIAHQVRQRARELLARSEEANTPRRLRRKRSLERIAA